LNLESQDSFLAFDGEGHHEVLGDELAVVLLLRIAFEIGNEKPAKHSQSPSPVLRSINVAVAEAA
jgi:hypothetical protein